VRVVVALGGNALLPRGEPLSAKSQEQNVRNAARILAQLATAHELIVTHGNGPQVGLLALQSDALEDVPAYPLDVLGAETEGMIGYLLARELRGSMPDREVATLLTQVEVDPGDAAFQHPSKPIGPSYTESRAKELAVSRGWKIVKESNGGFRRVVASPKPKAILEIEVIRLLVSAGVLVICAGGGGIPVARSADGALFGVEAVVDKDLASALLATRLGADFLLLLTDQPAVFLDWPEPASKPIGNTTIEELRAYSFEQGTMGPKVEAVCRFAGATGNGAAIGALSDASAILNGNAGTQLAAVRVA
jgi:carbamate kinase